MTVADYTGLQERVGGREKRYAGGRRCPARALPGRPPWTPGTPFASGETPKRTRDGGIRVHVPLRRGDLQLLREATRDRAPARAAPRVRQGCGPPLWRESVSEGGPVP